MFVTYKLSEKSFKKLRKKGVSDDALNDLTELSQFVFESKLNNSGYLHSTTN